MATKTQIQNSERWLQLQCRSQSCVRSCRIRQQEVRRIRERVRSGCYIRIEKDGKAKIEAYTQEAVKEAAKLIFNDYKALQNPEAHRSKPIIEIECDPTCVPHTVGKQGVGDQEHRRILVPSSSMTVDLRLRPTLRTMFSASSAF